MNPILSPGELKNIIKTSLAFSDSSNEFDYLKRLYNSICLDATSDLKNYNNKDLALEKLKF